MECCQRVFEMNIIAVMQENLWCHIANVIPLENVLFTANASICLIVSPSHVLERLKLVHDALDETHRSMSQCSFSFQGTTCCPSNNEDIQFVEDDEQLAIEVILEMI